MSKVVVHRGGRTVLTLDRTKSSEGLHVFLHRATTGARPFKTRDAEYETRRVPGGWVVTKNGGYRVVINEDCTEKEAVEKAKVQFAKPGQGSSDAIAATPTDVEKAKKILGDWESSSQEDLRWARRVLSRGESGDSLSKSLDALGAFLRPGSHRPETRSKKTPIDDADWKSGDPIPQNRWFVRGSKSGQAIVTARSEAEARRKYATNHSDVPAAEVRLLTEQELKARPDWARPGS